MTWVLVTGATGGIGRDAALAFARAGLHVIASGRDPRKLDALHAVFDVLRRAGYAFVTMREAAAAFA